MLNWWQRENMIGHVQEALAHINSVGTLTIIKNTEVCRLLFDALNKIWTAFNDYQGEPGRSDSKSITSLVINGMPNHAQEFSDDRAVQGLVTFQPWIMNHDTLRRRGYRPDREVETNVISEATEEHRQVANAYEDYKKSCSADTRERLLKKTAQLLYIVRSNIAHGEKTPYGPDMKKAERDETVCAIVKPVLFKLFQLIFDYPDQKLVVYGTLTPGAPNETILEGIDGHWYQCKIKGEIENREGLKYFRWNPNAGEFIAKILVSALLPDKLTEINRFEGMNYRRILIPVRTGDYFVIANIYTKGKNH